MYIVSANLGIEDGVLLLRHDPFQLEAEIVEPELVVSFGRTDVS